MKQRGSRQDRSCSAPNNVQFDYLDALIALYAHDVAAELVQLGGELSIFIPIVTTDGFFLMGCASRCSLPRRRAELDGWSLVLYVPEVCDPFDLLDLGAGLLLTDETDVEQMASVVAPTVKLISDVIAGDNH